MERDPEVRLLVETYYDDPAYLRAERRPGILANVHRVLAWLRWKWEEPSVFQISTERRIDFLQASSPFWEHLVRESGRQRVIALAATSSRGKRMRYDLQGVENGGVDIWLASK